MTPGPREAEAIRRLAEEARLRGRWDWEREGAERTGGLPVWAGIGGVLVLRPDGVVLFIDNNGGEIQEVRERMWIRLALVEAAKNHPELAAVAPLRPGSATDCRFCGGQGVVTLPVGGSLPCGECSGTGWRDQDLPPRDYRAPL